MISKDYSIYSVATGVIRVCMHGSEDFAAINAQADEAYVEGFGRAGIDKVIDGVVTQQPTPVEMIARAVLQERGRLLMISDWTQLPDVPIATKEAWATYRQALRDITLQPGYPSAVEWPASPGG